MNKYIARGMLTVAFVALICYIIISIIPILAAFGLLEIVGYTMAAFLLLVGIPYIIISAFFGRD